MRLSKYIFMHRFAAETAVVALQSVNALHSLLLSRGRTVVREMVRTHLGRGGLYLSYAFRHK